MLISMETSHLPKHLNIHILHTIVQANHTMGSINTHPFVEPLEVGHLLGLLQFLPVVLGDHLHLLTCCHSREVAHSRNINDGHLGECI